MVPLGSIMAGAINQEISDKLLERQLLVGRVESSLRRQVWDQLRILEDEILRVLKSTDPTAFVLLARRRREVQRLMEEEVNPLIVLRYERLAPLMDEAMMRLARQETGVVQEVVNTATDAETITEMPSERQLRAGVVLGIFPSATKPTDFATFAQDWWKRQGESLSQRMSDSLTVGVAREESLTDLTRRVRGSADNAFADGLMGKARQDASRLLTTQVSHALSEARVAVGRVNASQVVLQHHALLESRNVCVICFVRHGKRYTADAAHQPIGHALPYLTGVPYHNSCRCSMITVLSSGGAITDDTLATWLRRQGPAYQAAILGPTRARMFQAGKLSPKDLLAATTGKPLTLEELGT